MSIKAMHEWRLEPRDGGTHVETEESFSGLLARLFRGSLQKNLDKTERGSRAPEAPGRAQGDGALAGRRSERAVAFGGAPRLTHSVAVKGPEKAPDEKQHRLIEWAWDRKQA